MDPNERWIWLGDRVSAVEAGVRIYRAHPGAWWLVVGGEMAGPYDDGSVLRAMRAACTPTMDGCELGPTKPGFAELPKIPLQRGPGWSEASEHELPSSATTYSVRALEPVSGCCTTFDTLPRVHWEEPARGRLLSDWNAHPAGSLLVPQEPGTPHAGFTVIDVP